MTLMTNDLHDTLQIFEVLFSVADSFFLLMTRGLSLVTQW